jgi:hypothetical protein
MSAQENSSALTIGQAGEVVDEHNKVITYVAIKEIPPMYKEALKLAGLRRDTAMIEKLEAELRAGYGEHIQRSMF